MKIDNGDMSDFGGVTAGIQQEDKWQYPGIGYNASDGKFYIGEVESAALDFVPFALRQCKEVTDAAGVVHRYPIKTKRSDMAQGDTVTRLQVVGLVGDELHIFGAKSWTARAAWANPMGGPYHDANFEGGIWYRLSNHIKDVKANTGKATAPLCWQVHMEPGDVITAISKANPSNKTKTHPIKATSLRFVGAAEAERNAALYTEEDIDGWVSEWNKTGVTTTADNGGDAAPAMVAIGVTESDIPF